MSNEKDSEQEEKFKVRSSLLTILREHLALISTSMLKE
jgi:hypothetical protein